MVLEEQNWCRSGWGRTPGAGSLVGPREGISLWVLICQSHFLTHDFPLSTQRRGWEWTEQSSGLLLPVLSLDPKRDTKTTRNNSHDGNRKSTSNRNHSKYK